MRVLVTGASGLIGSPLVADLAGRGVETWRLVRRAPAGRFEVEWDPARGTVDAAGLEGFDAVVHLAGASLASGRWTAAAKARFWDSRVRATRLLAESLARAKQPPRVLISGSAIHGYGDRGDEILTEASSRGRGFLSDLAQAWEEAAASASDAGVRVVLLRTALVLSRHGGALPKMLVPFRLGLGAVLGNGRSWWTWIAIDDVIRIIRFAIERQDLSGGVNVTSPQPVTQSEFSRVLGRVLRRPVLFQAPAPLLRVMLGEMADQMLLLSTRAIPESLTRAGFRFELPELENALRHVIEAQAARPDGTTR